MTLIATRMIEWSDDKWRVERKFRTASGDEGTIYSGGAVWSNEPVNTMTGNKTEWVPA